MFGKLSALRSKVWKAMSDKAIDAQLSIAVTDNGPIIQVQVKAADRAKASKAVDALIHSGITEATLICIVVV
jgi:hypothetical protein